MAANSRLMTQLPRVDALERPAGPALTPRGFGPRPAGAHPCRAEQFAIAGSRSPNCYRANLLDQAGKVFRPSDGSGAIRRPTKGRINCRSTSPGDEDGVDHPACRASNEATSRLTQALQRVCWDGQHVGPTPSPSIQDPDGAQPTPRWRMRSRGHRVDPMGS